MIVAGTSRGVVSGRRRSGGALPRSAAGGQRRPIRTRAPLRESTTNVASRRRTRDPTVAVAGSVGPSKTERGDGNEFAIELDNDSNPEFTVVTVDIAEQGVLDNVQLLQGFSKVRKCTAVMVIVR